MNNKTNGAKQMLDMAINFILGLVIIGVPSYAFYRLGIDAGIERGVRRQLLRELTMSGIIEMDDPERRQTPRHTQRTA